MRPVRRQVVLVMTAALLGCQLPANVVYRCETDGTCVTPGTHCVDGLCVTSDDHDAGGGEGGGGGEAGGVGGGGVGGGGGSCVPETACPGALECGSWDAGCGVTLRCGLCTPPQECGVLQPNRCAQPKVCNPAGWCWENPLPQGATLRGAYTADEGHSWFVGSNGTLLRYDNERTRFEPVSFDGGPDLYAVHGTSASDVFVGGESTLLLHYDGQRWVVEGVSGTYTGTIRAVVAVDGGPVFAGGTGGHVFRRDATLPVQVRWVDSPLSPTTFNDVVSLWAQSPSDVWALTRVGEVYRLSTDGGSWQRETVFSGGVGAALWGAGDTVYGVGGVGVYARADGGWSHLTDIPSSDLKAMTGRGLDEAWIAGAGGGTGMLRTFDNGVVGAASLSNVTINALTVIADRLFAVGTAGAVVTVTPSSVSNLTVGSTQRVRGLCGSAMGVFGPSSSPVFGTARVLERVVSPLGPAWASRDVMLGSTQQLNGCFAQPTAVWAWGDDSKFLFRRGAGAFAAADFGGSHAGSYSSGWGLTTGPWWFVSTRSDITVTLDAGTSDTAFSSLLAPSPLASIAGLSTPFALYGVGVGTLVSVQLDGGVVTMSPPSGADMRGVFGEVLVDGGTRFVAVGNTSTLWVSSNGAPFVGSAVPYPTDLRAVWVSRSGETWVGGNTQGAFNVDGWLLRVFPDGGVVHDSVPVSSVGGLWGLQDGGTSVWLAGDNGAVLRKDVP